MTHRVVVGLGFGDEGKGRMVDYLCAENEIQAVVRFNGGPQAAHNVVMSDGRHHTFSQFGSGSMRNVPTFLSRHMLVNPFNIMKEYEHLRDLCIADPLRYLFIDRDATIITPYHVLANRERERRRGAGQHGTCGEGVGETMQLKTTMGVELKIKDIGDVDLVNRLAHIKRILEWSFDDDGRGRTQSDWPDPWDVAKAYYRVEPELRVVDGSKLDELMDAGDCVFEGAQGILLDEWYGFHPYTTWSTTTPDNALELLGERESEVIGVTRSYMTRHGAGPFPSEHATATQLMSAHDFPEHHNDDSGYQGSWRRGLLDLPMLSYASASAGRIDSVAITHMDAPRRPLVSAYRGFLLNSKRQFSRSIAKEDLEAQEQITQRLEAHPVLKLVGGPTMSDAALIDYVERAVHADVRYLGRGPTADRTSMRAYA